MFLLFLNYLLTQTSNESSLYVTPRSQIITIAIEFICITLILYIRKLRKRINQVIKIVNDSNAHHEQSRDYNKEIIVGNSIYQDIQNNLIKNLMKSMFNTNTNSKYKLAVYIPITETRQTSEFNLIIFHPTKDIGKYIHKKVITAKLSESNDLILLSKNIPPPLPSSSPRNEVATQIVNIINKGLPFYSEYFSNIIIYSESNSIDELYKVINAYTRYKFKTKLTEYIN